MTAADLDPAISDPPSDDVLANRLQAAVPDLDEDVALEVIEALRGTDIVRGSDSFHRQLAHRLDQARLRAARADD
jgi:hypothetical protein